ncbi:6926_t:CDS:2 [Ambispora gerdemannii]|uniref:6926_t:CDS:1 n=1 Tax=Ambispora gerdemannii TaxID=144530 RepID=A0A9N9H534_9GLOM|nr:6926_t:CDS:2 [Ambispora gerdemannii]
MAAIATLAHRVRIALAETNLANEQSEIDLQNKPSWYTDIYPLGKVPTIKYGDTLLAESSIIVEFIAELAQETSNILPKDLVQRAQARIFIVFFGKFSGLLWALVKNQDDEKVNDQLVKQSPTGPYFLGEAFSITDIAAAPFVARLNISLEVGIIRGNIKIPTGEGYERYHQWAKSITSRKSVKETLPMATELVTAYNRIRNQSSQE